MISINNPLIDLFKLCYLKKMKLNRVSSILIESTLENTLPCKKKDSREEIMFQTVVTLNIPPIDADDGSRLPWVRNSCNVVKLSYNCRPDLLICFRLDNCSII